jgi:hypothetical protein
MTTLRSIRPLAAGALLLTAGAVVVFGLNHGDRADPPANSQADQSTINASRGQGEADGLEQAERRGLALRLDDALEVAPAAPVVSPSTDEAADISRHGVDAEAAGAFVENDESGPGLDLTMPATTEPDNLAQAEAELDVVAAREAEQAVQQSRLALAADEAAGFDPKVETFNIFNPEYGLRGFMKQNWINQRVAFQGGLGLDDDRIDKTSNDGLRDNIAVGMGLILAF